ncbi:hypothetical protein DOZ80_16275 [Pseudomonas fluorescens]|uniref:Uncharacterized protein n=1 Tax=Pseudomonas fluorescens TaxID=294 RepID=A0A327N0Y1_PSEFL|nr:hypothetical protein DOZ80_16275 [Pseudomonas fluorescens]
MGVNDDAFCLLTGATFECIASKLAPTEGGRVIFQKSETQKPAFAGFCEIQGSNLEFELVPRRRLELPRP